MRRLFAFWKYDLPPYVLGGEVTRMNDNGAVETQNYGRNNWFKPIKLMPVKQGRILLERLEKREAEHRKAERELHDKLLKDLAEIFPERKFG